MLCIVFAGMVCLLDVYKNKKQNIAEDCSKMLAERISLWQLIVTVSYSYHRIFVAACRLLAVTENRCKANLWSCVHSNVHS